MAETTDSIELPDCEYESLLELFRFLYSDKKVIDKQTEEGVTSDEFVTLERSLVESVVKRERLNVKEVELFKAVDRWATKEIERQGITPGGKTKRRILGEEIVKAIRFPLMSQKVFVSVVFDCYILTFKEISDMMKYYSDVLSSSLPIISSLSSLPFVEAPRTALVYRCSRFAKFPLESNSWGYSSSTADRIFVTVNKPIMLHRVQHFGSKGGKHTVSTEVKDTTDGSSLVKQSGSYASVHDETCGYYGFDVLFNHPVNLVENKQYELVSLIKGPLSCYGEEQHTSVGSEGVQFVFRSSPIACNGTSDSRGQFPAFVFSLFY
ncbi:BTB/POZ domain-containing protein 6-B-like [Oculina patagonica]